MTVLITNLLYDIVDDYRSGAFGTYQERQRVAEVSEVERILMCCILSSGWLYEKARAATDYLRATLRLDEFSALPTASEFENALRSGPDRHRFPRVKAQQLLGSLEFVRSHDSSLQEFLHTFPCESSARSYVSGNYPGLGLKQSSMFLRDIGFAKNLAIVDSHILWYIENTESITIKNMTPNIYLELEKRMLEMADDLEVSIDSLDTILWVLIREFKKTKRRNGCGMQYALPLEG